MYYQAIIDAMEEYAAIKSQSLPKESFRLSDEDVFTKVKELKNIKLNGPKGSGNMSIGRMHLGELEWMNICIDLIRWYRDQVQINLRKELIKISEYIRDGWIMDVRYNSDKIINEYLNQKQ